MGHWLAVDSGNAGRIEGTGGDFLFYEEGVTDSVGRLIEAVDQERIAIGAKLGIEIEGDPAMGMRQGYMLADNYGSAYREAPGFLGIAAQPSLDHRYLNEDVGYGLVFMSRLARQVGVDVPSFSEAIRRALRQDPDVILVGELRDLETIEAAISAAETGHVVFGTLHTNSAQGTVNRIIDAFPGNLQDQIRTQLASTLIGVVAQTLLPRIGGGRCAAYEVLNVTPGVANLIRENKTFRINSAMQTGAKFGMQLMDDALFHHWKGERVTVEDVLAKAHRPDDLAKRIVQSRRGLGDEAVPIQDED